MERLQAQTRPEFTPIQLMRIMRKLALLEQRGLLVRKSPESVQ